MYYYYCRFNDYLVSRRINVSVLLFSRCSPTRTRSFHLTINDRINVSNDVRVWIEIRKRWNVLCLRWISKIEKSNSQLNEQHEQLEEGENADKFIDNRCEIERLVVFNRQYLVDGEISFDANNKQNKKKQINKHKWLGVSVCICTTHNFFFNSTSDNIVILAFVIVCRLTERIVLKWSWESERSRREQIWKVRSSRMENCQHW